MFGFSEELKGSFHIGPLSQCRSFFNVSSRRSDQVPQGTLGCSGMLRQWALLSLNEEVDVVFFEPSTEGSQYFLQKLSLEVDVVSKGRVVTETFDSQEMATVFLKVCCACLETFFFFFLSSDDSYFSFVSLMTTWYSREVSFWRSISTESI